MEETCSWCGGKLEIEFYRVGGFGWVSLCKSCSHVDPVLAWCKISKETKRVGFDIASMMHEQLKKWCEFHGVSMTEFFRMAVYEYVNKLGVMKKGGFDGGTITRQA